MTERIYVTLVIPCYNETEVFEKSMPRIEAQLRKLGKPFEIILVEDQSRDDTAALVKKYCEDHPFSRAIFHPRNRGRGQSVMDGLAKARGEYCGFLDIDLEVSEKYLPKALEALEEGADVVIGNRTPKNAPAFRTLLHHGYARLMNLVLSLPFHDVNAGFKFFRTTSIQKLLPCLHEHHWFWDTEVVLKSHLAGYQVHELPVVYEKNPTKKSTVRVLNDTLHFLEKTIEYATKKGRIRKELRSLMMREKNREKPARRR
ncbi:MAG: glycosyltransferase family 2 protein, partial [Candidatus Diapherotrites archaeon]|nr:glycosyltransferase family 2 protein [Candidatus Diapherotrites archaeon]